MQHNTDIHREKSVVELSSEAGPRALLAPAKPFHTNAFGIFVTHQWDKIINK
jgi:hypothetical protein